MIDATEALVIASSDFENRLRLIKAEDWNRRTPCTDWNVRALVNHVVGGNRRYTALLHGASLDEVEATRTVDHLGEDPIASFITTADDVLAAFREEGALSRRAHHGAGERTGAQLLGMRVLDVAVHGWDLAVAIGADDTVDADLVEFLLDLYLDLDRAHELGALAEPPRRVPDDASAQMRLLHLVGRDRAGVNRRPESPA